jgi:fatty acid desaturase
MDTPKTFHKDRAINWYRCHVDKQVMAELMRTRDWPGFRQVGLQIGLFIATGALAYLAYLNITAANWYWSVPLLLLALFVHGTNGPFMGFIAVHELCHKTPFRSKFWNEFFLKLYSFISWSDYVWFRPSHIKHHQLTVHQDYDGEVVLPQNLTLKDWKFWLGLIAWNPLTTRDKLKTFFNRSRGRLDSDWYRHVLPESNEPLRREHRNWARFVLIGHALLAAAFILSGHWFLIVVFTIGTQYCSWLGFLTGMPQHIGLSPNVPDHRLCCRTFTCSRLTAFYYWNMQYHIEHHMFPAVPFYNLGKLRKVIEHDLPPAPHGLWATWKEILAIHKKQIADPAYCYVPPLPKSPAAGEHADDAVLEREAALAA